MQNTPQHGNEAENSKTRLEELVQKKKRKEKRKRKQIHRLLKAANRSSFPANICPALSIENKEN
jgi:hypothetical protein